MLAKSGAKWQKKVLRSIEKYKYMWRELKTFEEENHVDDVEYVDSHVLWTFKSVGEPG